MRGENEEEGDRAAVNIWGVRGDGDSWLRKYMCVYVFVDLPERDGWMDCTGLWA